MRFWAKGFGFRLRVSGSRILAVPGFLWTAPEGASVVGLGSKVSGFSDWGSRFRASVEG